MIVTCESCKAKFNLNPDRLKGPKSKVRCTRCGHVFSVNSTDEDVLIHVDLSDEPFDDVDDMQPSPKAGIRSRHKRRLSMKLAAMVVLPILLLGGGVFVMIQKGVFSSSSQTPAETAPQEKTSPAEVEQPSVYILDTTNAYFIENSHAGQIFVVEGEVVNESNKPISFILLEGKLYTRDNRVAQSQRCFSGNIMARNELAQLNVTEIQNRMMNREGKDLVNVQVPPARRVPFMLVFHNLPELDALSDYSIEVISAKAE